MIKITRYYVCFLSVLNLFIAKVRWYNKLKISGIPVCIRINNIGITDSMGELLLGKRINVSKGTRLSIVNDGNIKIGDFVYFNRNCSIISRGSISIGKQCRFGPNVCLFDHDHIYGLEGVTDNYRTGSISIGERCWIGANAVILRDSEIGDGCVIGAGVVFKGKLPPHSLVYSDKSGMILKTISEDK